MRNPSRLPMGLSLLVLSVLALPGQAAEAEKYLPNDSEAIITIRVPVLLDSALVKRGLDQVKATLKNNAEYQKIVEALGLDPFKDVDLILFGGPGGGDPDKVAYVIQGKFNVAKMQAMAVKAAGDDSGVLKIEKAGSTELYVITPPGKNQKTTYAAILDDKFLVGSPSRDNVVDAIEKKKGQKKSELKKVLTELLAKQDSKQAISIAATDAVGQGNLSGLVKSMSGGITIDDAVKMEFVLNAKDEKAAESVAQEAKNGLQTASLIVFAITSKDDRFKPLQEVVQGIKVTPSESMVTIKADISKEVIEKLEKAIKEGKAPKKPKDANQ